MDTVLIPECFTSHPVCEKHGWPVNSISCRGFTETTETIETGFLGRKAQPTSSGWSQSIAVLIASTKRVSQQKNAFFVCGSSGFRHCIAGNKITIFRNRNETIAS
ncbi:hypothetical protein Q4481_02100 [Rhizobium alvei]|uniref:Uncharacterized protein n=1 Tax=Rhizobium alvei TaxID=1132659 RepID=A0ABT8YGF8_9HYPH|nr:hypothetical protein [Rhizobium alvei]